MDDNVRLSELQRDAIVELLNIGMGNAACSLNEIVNQEIKLSIPSLELITRQMVANRLNHQPKTKITAVKQHFSGPFWGEALLLFSQENSLQFMNFFINNDVPPNMLAELEVDALTEMGNIILNACLSSFANHLAHELRVDLPIFLTGTATDILEFNANRKNEVVMFLQMNFSVQSTEIEGYVALIFEMPSIKQFQISVDKYLGEIGQ